jgi:hypothetical protein
MPDRPGIPVILCLDVEPDEAFVDRARPGPWQGYESAVAFVDRFRRQLEARTGRRTTFAWFFRMDPQVAEAYGEAAWVVRRHAGPTSMLLDAGDEPGLHVHGYRWDAAARGWIVDHGNQDWIDHCVGSSFEAFERALGRACLTFRFGDRWMSNDTMRVLEAAGVRYDLTPEPGHGPEPAYRPDHPYTGSLPDYSDVPPVPYRPARDDYRRPDPSRRDGPWVIPVTTAPVQASILRRLYSRAFEPRRSGGFSTALASHEPGLFARIAEHALRRPLPHLVLPLRVGALAVPRLARRVSANLAMLLAHPLSDRLSWVTPADALTLMGADPDGGRR